ncbi:TetR/AcrR family transcriptional regulator [Nocardioides pantholopis]|uniref:TetR/AcrR family transcriptional regulator n=1 Tax=Nocardioides pantholopis TaxID=2483798 RepID=UPI000F081336|nr:TetR/AcrR family transcriptional regulator [Nocardioides pantholopis]
MTPPRATPMPAERRREALVDVTLELLREHGRDVTTRQIAQAAGIAEGTIFRACASKEELVAAAIERAFVPGEVLDRLAEIDRDAPFEQRMVLVAEVLQARYRATFDLMAKVGLVRPPESSPAAVHRESHLERLTALMVEIVGADADLLDVPAEEFVHRLRLLVFVGSHPELSDGRTLGAEAAVRTVLHGLLRRPEGEES